MVPMQVKLPRVVFRLMNVCRLVALLEVLARPNDLPQLRIVLRVTIM